MDKIEREQLGGGEREKEYLGEQIDLMEMDG